MARTKQEGPSTPIKILNAIAFASEIEQYRIPKATELSYRTILRELETLEKREYIRLARTEPSSKGGKDKKIYTLTFKGFIHALINNKDNRELIIDKYPEMLLVTKKWGLFVSLGIKPQVLQLLNNSLISQVLNTLRYQKINLKLTYPSDQAWQNEIDDFILMSLLTNGPFTMESDVYVSILKAFINDPEISAFIQTSLNRKIATYQALVNFNAEWEKIKKTQ